MKITEEQFREYLSIERKKSLTRISELQDQISITPQASEKRMYFPDSNEVSLDDQLNWHRTNLKAIDTILLVEDPVKGIGVLIEDNINSDAYDLNNLKICFIQNAGIYYENLEREKTIKKSKIKDLNSSVAGGKLEFENQTDNRFNEVEKETKKNNMKFNFWAAIRMAAILWIGFCFIFFEKIPVWSGFADNSHSRTYGSFLLSACMGATIMISIGAVLVLFGISFFKK